MKENHGYSFLGKELEDDLYRLGEYYLYYFKPSGNARVKNRSNIYVSLLRAYHKLVTGEPLISEDEVRRQIECIYNKISSSGDM